MTMTRALGRFPFASYPVGWFRVAWSDELLRGAVVPLRFFGRELVALRGDDGEARLYDAYCPHLGAHLGHGGCVVDGTLRCPFHGWRFDRGGACVHIPYADKIPPRAQLRTWTVLEVNGAVLAYHDAHKAPVAAWSVPPLEELASPAWSPGSRHRWHVRTHVQDVAENLVDGAHFGELHSTAPPKTEVELAGTLARSSLRMQMHTPRGPVLGGIDITLYGLGFFVARFTGIVETLLIVGATPVADEQVELAFSFYTRGPSSNTTTSLIAEIVRQTEQDIVIWEHKAYHTAPLLCAGDGPIAMLRRWSRQFYAEPHLGVSPG
jgi:phenylpropionate dioxygenase-like ring-hydroxylating dioxygenase large terminal subunit